MENTRIRPGNGLIPISDREPFPSSLANNPNIDAEGFRVQIPIKPFRHLAGLSKKVEKLCIAFIRLEGDSTSANDEPPLSISNRFSRLMRNTDLNPYPGKGSMRRIAMVSGIGYR